MSDVLIDYPIIKYNQNIYLHMGSENIEEIFQKSQNDQKYLSKLLTRGRTLGFENFINRKIIWPFLMQIDNKKIKQSPMFEWKGGMDQTSDDYEQLKKDAERSLSSMKTFENITPFHLKKRQEAVLAVLDTFFAKNTDLNYIQGFHDVASIFLILFGNNAGYYLMEKTGRAYFHDFLKYDFGKTSITISKMIYEIVTKADPEFVKIYQIFENSQLLTFLLPWVLTWFSHNFSSVKVICRIWDYLLCSGPHAVLYLTSGIILATKNSLKEECDEYDEPSIHTFYKEQVRREMIDIEECIKIAIDLQEEYKIEQTEAYSQLEEGSTFRLSNFYDNITIHKHYLIEKQQSKNRKQNLLTAAKVITSVAVFGAVAYLGWKYGKRPILS